MKYYRKLEGERVYLSPMNPDDYAIYWQWINDLSTGIPIGNATKNYTLMKEKEALEHLADGQAFAIVRSEDDLLLGNCSLFDISQLHRSATLGIFIGDKDNRGKGYGQEATRLLLSYGFKLLNMNNIMLQVFAFNERGISAYKKVGFKEFGRRNEAFFVGGKYFDEVYMEILAKDHHCELLDDVISEIVR